MMLHWISAEGIMAFCSDLIVDPEEKEYVYFLGVGGYQIAVKGILASLLEDKLLHLTVDNQTYWICRTSAPYLMKIKKLPSGLCHGVVLLRTAVPNKDGEDATKEFLLISNEPEKIKTLFYRHLEQKTEIPLHASWTQWLWSLHERNGWLIRLETLVGRYHGYLVTLQQSEMLSEIAQAVQTGVPEIVNCMIGGGSIWRNL